MKPDDKKIKGEASDPRKEEEVVAFLLLLTDSEFTETIIKDLRDMIEVVESHIIYGDWDLIIKVRIPALSDLTKLVMRLRKMQGIKKTSTLITLAN